jgi:hypothetical protein
MVGGLMGVLIGSAMGVSAGSTMAEGDGWQATNARINIANKLNSSLVSFSIEEPFNYFLIRRLLTNPATPAKASNATGELQGDGGRVCPGGSGTLQR